MTCDLMFIGHISTDYVENRQGVKVQAGGSALYASMAAKTLLMNVALVSAVGKDYKFTDALWIVGTDYVKTVNMPSTRFNIRYNESGEADYLEAAYGAGARITASIIPTQLLAPETIVHISPMQPTKVDQIVKKIRMVSPKTRISVNTWINYIKQSRRNKELLRHLAQEVDFFILNDNEAKALTDTSSIPAALTLLKARMLVITLGELGAIAKGRDTGIQMIPALAMPERKIVDTTGAGDVWCGAFLATYKITGELLKSVTIASILSSIKCSGWNCKKLINLQFRKPDNIIEYVIGLKEGALQRRLPDYSVP